MVTAALARVPRTLTAGSAVKVPDGNGGAGSRSAYANGTTMVLDATACDAETCGADNWETPPFLCFSTPVSPTGWT